MFKFSIGQVETLNKSFNRNFQLRLASFLRENVPEATESLSEESLYSFIDRQSRSAAVLGVTSEAGVTQFACLALAIGDDFQNIPEISKYMSLPTPSAEEKLDELVNILYRMEKTGNTDALASLLSDD